MTRNFSRFLKFNKRKTGNPFGNKKFYKDKKDESIPRCFRCNSKKHLKADCPLMKNESGKQKEVAKYKDKEANYATWGESDAEMLSSDEEDKGFKNGVCFMAGSSKVSSQTYSSDSDSDDSFVNDTPFEDINDAYETMVIQWKRQSKEFLSSGKAIEVQMANLRPLNMSFMK